MRFRDHQLHHEKVMSRAGVKDLERLQHQRRKAYFRLSLFHYVAVSVVIFLITLLLMSPLLSVDAFSSRYKPLTFTKNGTFQISVFEDLHFGEAEDTVWGPQQDIKSIRVMNTVLDNESPQLVVLNGDLITGEDTSLSNSTAYLDRIVQPMVQRGLPWASTYGNHDSEYNLSRLDLLAHERRCRNSLTRQIVHTSTSGVTNYYLPVYADDVDPQSHNAVPELILWFFDSRGGNLFQQTDRNGHIVPQQDWVDKTVVSWFNRTKKSLAAQYNNTIVSSLAFVHIPVDAMLAFQSGPGVKPHQEPGINEDVPIAQQGQGWASETQLGSPDSYAGQDVPFMAALLDTPGLMAIFSGHDHGNDWCAKWSTKLPGMNLTGNGLNLCFGRHTGYGGYGTWTRGARQIVVDLEKMRHGQGIETYIRLEDGSESGRVVLNATYSEDQYPEVPVRYSPEVGEEHTGRGLP